MTINKDEKLFSVNDLTKFLEWAVDHYRLEGCILTGTHEQLIIEYIENEKTQQ